MDALTGKPVARKSKKGGGAKGAKGANGERATKGKSSQAKRQSAEKEKEPSEAAALDPTEAERRAKALENIFASAGGAAPAGRMRTRR